MEVEIKKILEFLRDKEIWEIVNYDVKLEDGALQGYIDKNYSSSDRTKETMDKLLPWERMCYYKVSGTTGTDCDVALFNMVVYDLAYGLGEKGWKIGKYYSNYQLSNPKLPSKSIKWVFRGDTMNSYATSVHGYIRDVWKPSKEDEMKSKGILNEKGHVNSKFRRNYWEDVILRHKHYFQGVLPDNAQKYIRLNHTIGNFIPVPFVRGGGQFNSPRGIGETKDFWDLALLAIYHYYHEDYCLTEYLSFALRNLVGDAANVKLCKAWLNSFEGASGEEKWDAFVEQNFMQDFVDEKKEHYGMPIPLWDNHFTGDVMPKEEKHYNEFFKKASARIEKRGVRIAEAIKEKLGNDVAIEKLAEKMTNQ